MYLTKTLAVTLILSIIIIGCGEDSENNEISDTGGEIIWQKDNAPMVLIPAGEFEMGDHHGEIHFTFDDASLPVHNVYLDAFYIDKYEVTNARYLKFMEDTGYNAPKYWDNPDFNIPAQPVVGVTWFDAQEYCKWAGKRLPTEAEWEKAARGGLIGKRYPWGDEEPDGTKCNFADKNTDLDWSNKYVDDGYQYTAQVGNYSPNGYGLYDIAGNVWEWCADWYDSNYYSYSPDKNPTGPASGEYRVARGGSWYNESSHLLTADRVYYVPDKTNQRVGIRCCISQSLSP